MPPKYILSRVFSTFDMDKLGKIRRHHWKERIKISKIAKFQSDLLKTNEVIAPQSREILYLFPTIKTSVNFLYFAELYLCSLQTYHLQIWQHY